MTNLIFSDDVRDALATGAPVVALESTIIAHGLPHPENLACAQRLEAIVREEGAVPATIAVVDGQPAAGLSADQLAYLAEQGPAIPKLGSRDIPVAIARGTWGATTVSATMAIAAKAGIALFATGGIGGVHREAETTFDISTDIRALSRHAMTVVCSGAKSILDIPKTLEALESAGVTVAGFGTDRFPAFYTAGTEAVEHRIDDVDTAARLSLAVSDAGGASLLMANPIPPEHALGSAQEATWIAESLAAAAAAGVSGKQLTPFLLGDLHARSGGATLVANVALVESNTRLAARIATARAALARAV